MRVRYGILLLALVLAISACERAETDPAAPAAEEQTPSPEETTAVRPAPLEEPVPAPPFTLPGPGESFVLGEHRGEIVVLHFWATWNELSQDGLAALSTLHAELADDGVAFVGIAEDEDGLAALEAWAAEHEALPFPLVADTAGAVAEAYGDVELLPTTVVVDRQGAIRTRHTGILSHDELLDLLGPVLIEDNEPLTDFLPPGEAGVVQALSAAEVPGLIADGAMLVDVRRAEARSLDGAVPDAQHRPLARLRSDDLPANYAVPVIFFSDVEGDAVQASERALGWGYVAVYRVEGGLQAWREAGLPLQPVRPDDPPPVVPARSVFV